MDFSFTAEFYATADDSLLVDDESESSKVVDAGVIDAVDVESTPIVADAEVKAE
jgi:hypothetical protein